MSKKRVHEIAKEFGVESKQVISILQQHNFNVTKAVNTVDDAGYTVVKNQLGGKSNGADTKAAVAPANPSKHEKATRLNIMIKNMTIRNLMFVMYKLMSLLKDKIMAKNKMVVTIKNKIVQMVLNKAKRMMVNKVKKMITVTMVMQITATAMAV